MHDWIRGTKRGNVTPEEKNIDRKRSRSEQSSCECTIHCTDNDTELVTPKDEESWSTPVRAAAVRKHKPLLDIAETLNEGEIPSIYYHRKCRSVFTMKKLLETISKQQGSDNQQPTTAKRTSPTTSTTCEHVCIFCEKKSKYLKGTRNREPLLPCRDLLADHSIRKSAMEKKDSRILAIASREIVAAEACYHRTCYKGYTRAEASPTVASRRRLWWIARRWLC